MKNALSGNTLNSTKTTSSSLDTNNTPSKSKSSENIAPAPVVGIGDEFILSGLVESGFMTGSIKTVFERGKQDTFQETLDRFIELQKQKIQKLCNDHYDEFLKSSSQLKKLRSDAQHLKDKVIDLNEEVQEAGGRALDRGLELVKFRQISYNIQQQLQLLERCKFAAKLTTKSMKQIQDKKYYPALVTLEQLENSLQNLKAFEFSQFLERAVPKFKDRIRSQVETQFNDWLIIVKKKSGEVGQSMFELEKKKYQTLSQAATNAPKIQETEKPMIEEKKTAKKKKKQTSLIEPEKPQPTTSQPLDFSEEKDVFERLGIDFTPVYTCRHIFSTLKNFEEFQSYYKHNREIQIRHEMKNQPRIVFHQLTEDGLPGIEAYKQWLCRILGYFAVEHYVLETTEEILSTVDFNNKWEGAIQKIVNHLKIFFFDPLISMDFTSNNNASKNVTLVKEVVKQLLDMKQILCLFCFASYHQLHIHVNPIWEMLEYYRDKFSSILIRLCKYKCSSFLEDSSIATLQQFDAQNQEQLNQLQEFGLITSEEAVMDKKKFPISIPFPPLIVKLTEMIVQDLMDPFFEYGRFLIPINVDTNTSSSIYKSNPSSPQTENEEKQRMQLLELRYIIEQVLMYINQQFDVQIDRAPHSLSQFAQTAVNSFHFIKSFAYFEKYYFESKNRHAAVQWVKHHSVDHQLTKGTDWNRLVNPTPWKVSKNFKEENAQQFYKVTAKVSKLFDQTRQRAEDMILRAIMLKTDEMMMLSETVDWANGQFVKNRCHDFIQDAVRFIEGSYSTLRFLDKEKQEYIIFKSCEHLVQKLIDLLCGGDILEMNIAALETSKMDVECIEKFGLSLTNKVKYSFDTPKKMIDFVLQGNQIVKMNESMVEQVEQQPFKMLTQDTYKKVWLEKIHEKTRQFRELLLAEQKMAEAEVESWTKRLESILIKLKQSYENRLMKNRAQLQKRADQEKLAMQQAEAAAAKAAKVQSKKK